MLAVERCRTEALGGHLDECESCGHFTISYNSCRNRHCPKCQSLAQARWIEGRLGRILPTHYFHVVFTLPHSLRPLALRAPEPIYDLLFATASATLLELGRDPMARSSASRPSSTPGRESSSSTRTSTASSPAAASRPRATGGSP